MKSETSIYPGKDKALERQNLKLKSSKVSKNNKKLILDFQTYLASTGSGKVRIAKLTGQLKRIALISNKDFSSFEKKDLMKVIAHFNHSDYSDATKADYRRVLKQFFKYYEDEDKRSDTKILYKFIKQGISSAYKEKQIEPNAILTEEDIEAVVRSCTNIRDKAFIKFLHETGLRAGEMLGLKIENIALKKNIGLAYVDGKTGRRTVQFTKSMSYIVRWLDVHPLKDKGSYLWVSCSNNTNNSRLGYRNTNKIIHKSFTRANVSKKHNLHWFRHSRATLNAPHWPEVIMCKYFGWVVGSTQVRTYCHISPKQIEDAFMKMNGLGEVEEQKSNKPQICGCGETNDCFARYCFRCGNPLSVQIAVQDKEIIHRETDNTIKEMVKMFQDPEMIKAFVNFKEAINRSNT